MEVLQTLTFVKKVKKLHRNQKKELDNAIREICANPRIGEVKKGDLSDIWVYKFRMVNQLTLLAYQYHNKELIQFKSLRTN